MNELDEPIVRTIQISLAENPYVQTFIAAGQIAGGVDDLHLVIHEAPGVDLRTHNRPTSNEVAAIIVDENAEFSRHSMVFNKTGGLRTITDLNPAYDPLHFPLLHPCGDPGWCAEFNMPMVSLREFYSYRLFTRQNPSELLHKSGRLFQQWCVEQYVKMELQRLRFMKKNQTDFRAELYRGRMDAVLSDANLGKVGKFVLLPPSFTGGERYMRKQYYDSMAIVRELGKPDLFITVTCNPEWSEIKDNLNGMQAENRPDIVVRVFRQKFDSIKKDIVVNDIFGPVSGYVYVIEFQKRGLPHAHMLIQPVPIAEIQLPYQRRDMFHGHFRQVSVQYVHKGHDRAVISVPRSDAATEDSAGERVVNTDEIEQFLSGRYISGPEACWWLFRIDLQGKSHTVVQFVVFNPDGSITLKT